MGTSTGCVPHLRSTTDRSTLRVSEARPTGGQSADCRPTAVYLDNREGGGGGLGGRHFTKGGRRTRSSLEGLFGGTFRRWRAPSNYIFLINTRRLFVVGGRLRAPSNIFSVNTIAIGGRRTIAKGAEAPKGGMAQWPPCRPILPVIAPVDISAYF